jgi:lysophospholipase L1-like esterase
VRSLVNTDSRARARARGFGIAVLVSAGLLTSAAVADGARAAGPQAAPAAKPEMRILVMGDSYSAGNGAGDYSGAAGCYRSSRDYAQDFAAILRGKPYFQPASVTNAACSGAVTADFFHPRSGRPPELSYVNSTYDLIFLTIGGNDVDFADVVKYCLIAKFRDGANCNPLLGYAEKLISDGTMRNRITSVLTAIHAKADPLTKIVLLGYPFLEGDTGYTLRSGHGDDAPVIKVGQRLHAIGVAADALDQSIVKTLNGEYPYRPFEFISVHKLFDGPPYHGLYAKKNNPNRWMVQPFVDASLATYETWYHPNPTGWSEEAKLLIGTPGVPKAPVDLSGDPAIKVSDADYGSLPAGQTTIERLTATGGTAPYGFYAYGPDQAAVPAWVTLSTGGTITVDPPADASATVAFHVYAVDSSGRHSPFTSSLVLFAVGAGGSGQPSFAHEDAILGSPGLTLPQTTCVTSTFCLAIGTGGEVHSYDGTGWTDQLGLAGEDAQSVSCASTTFCAVSVYNGLYTSDNGTQWDNFYSSSGPEQYVSCPAAGQCVVATSASSSDLDDGVFSGQAPLPAGYNLLGLGCASMDFCLAMGEAGPDSGVNTTTFNGTSWSALSELASAPYLNTPSCTPGGSCYLVGNGKAYAFSPSGRTLLGAPSGQQLVAVSCVSLSSCQASTMSGRVASYDGHGWSTGPVVDPGSSLATLSCPTLAFCAGQSAEGYTAYLMNGSWTMAQRTDPDGFIAAISCRSATFCAALDTVGEVTFFNGSTWSAPRMVDPLGNAYQAGSIACPTTSFCAMVDSNGRAFTFNGSRWSAATTLSTIWLDSVSCASSKMCVAIDAYGLAYVFNGKSWSAGYPTGLIENGYLQAVSCPTSGFCMAVGGDSAASYSGGKWSEPVVIAPKTASLHAVSCISATFCLAGDRESSDLVAYFDGTWSKPWSLNTVFYNDAISCLSTYVCVTVGDQGGVWVTGTSIMPLYLSGVLMNNEESLAADCPSASVCFAGVAGTIEW